MAHHNHIDLMTLSNDGFNNTTVFHLPCFPNHPMPSSSSSCPSSLHKLSTSASSSFAGTVSVTGSDANKNSEQSPRRLTRQRKLRHLSNQDLGFHLPEKSRSSPTSPEYSTRKSRSPPDTAGSNCRCASSSAPPQGCPQPLPLPESFMIRRPDSVAKDGIGRRRSTDQVATGSASVRVSRTHHGASSQEVNAGRFNHTLGLNSLNVFPRSTAANAISSHPLSPHRSNVVDVFPSHVAATTWANFPSNAHSRKSQDINFEYVNCNLSRSAPTSVLSSPAVSPRRRSNTGDHFPSFMTHREYQDAFPPKLSPNKPAHSPSHSPLHSPTNRSPRFNQRGSNGFASDWPESNGHVNAHPLPLPPGAGTSSQSSMTSISSMKGQWQKGKLIGRGTFGSVYIATNRETGALCAMKEVDLIPDDPKSAECIKQLEQEIKVLRTLKHPNIVQYYGSEMIDDHFYIYLEYIHPGSINKYVQDHIGAMTESVVRNFTRHILSGLAFLHSTKTIHRDIKGANLLVDASGTVKLADFGMAKHLSGQSYNLSLKGSPYWMAPEVIKAVIQNDADSDLALAVDIWSLGCTIIEMFNGKPPWSDFTGPQAMFKVLNKTPPIPETLSAEGKDFLNCCFRRNPAERPSASTLLDHPFVRNSQDHNVSMYTQTFSMINIMDKLHSPRDHIKQKVGRMLVSPRTSN